MSNKYNEYLMDHINAVKKAMNWICGRFPDIREKMKSHPVELYHDDSKASTEEYIPYDDYFYGNRSSEVVEKFKYAWLHHIHNNPHHWQYWVLINDDEPEEALEMPFHFVVEMICDWWSFSWVKGDLTTVFTWYNQHKDSMRLHPKTRELVEDILNRIKAEIAVGDATESIDTDVQGIVMIHHGIKGQKWGVKNGPPYPLNSENLAKQLYLNAKKYEPKITKDVTESAEKSGSKIYGIEHKLKTEDSIKRKIDTDSKEKDISIGEAAASIKDTIRYTTISSDDSFVDNYEKFKISMNDKGYKEIRCKNYFDLYNKGQVKHKSVQSVFETPDGHIFEVQFHTPASQEAKNKKLPIYEERRKTGLSKERQIELEMEMERLAENIPEPKNISRIKTY